MAALWRLQAADSSLVAPGGTSYMAEQKMDHAINLVVFAILTLAGLVMEGIGFIDGVLARVMTALHVPANAQIILLVVAAVWLAVRAVRALGGVFAALILVLLLLLVLHRALPGMRPPVAHLVAPIAGQTAI